MHQTGAQWKWKEKNKTVKAWAKNNRGAELAHAPPKWIVKWDFDQRFHTEDSPTQQSVQNVRLHLHTRVFVEGQTRETHVEDTWSALVMSTF